MLVHVPQLAADLGSGSVRQEKVENDRVRRFDGGERVRLLGRSGLVDFVAGRLERGRERPQDLRLVVDDEDPRRGHRSTVAGSSAASKAIPNADPCPGCDSAHTRPPFASTNPRVIARPRPLPPTPSLDAR